jgi:hypothetical protein
MEGECAGVLWPSTALTTRTSVGSGVVFIIASIGPAGLQARPRVIYEGPLRLERSDAPRAPHHGRRQRVDLHRHEFRLIPVLHGFPCKGSVGCNLVVGPLERLNLRADLLAEIVQQSPELAKTSIHVAAKQKGSKCGIRHDGHP